MLSTAEKLSEPQGREEKSRCAAIDPCKLCAHSLLISVDLRCKACGLRGRRFFEVKHASKEQ